MWSTYDAGSKGETQLNPQVRCSGLDKKSKLVYYMPRFV